MNRKQLNILIVMVVLLGGLGLILKGRKTDNWSASTQDGKLFPEFPINEIAIVTLRDHAGELNLLKQEGSWSVKERGGFVADFETVGGFLTKVWDLKAVQSIEVGESHLDRLELLSPEHKEKSAVEAEFRDTAGKTLASLRLGKEHMQPGQGGPMGGGGFADGRYVMAGDDLSSVSLVDETFSDIQVKPESWLKKDFFKVESAKRIAYHPAETNQSPWTLSRTNTTAEWMLSEPAEGEILDASKTSSFNYVLSNPSFADVLVGEVAISNAFVTVARAELETFDGFQYEVRIGKANDSDQYPIQFTVKAELPSNRASVEGESDEDKAVRDKEFEEKQAKLKEKLQKESALAQWTYLVTKWTVDPLMKSRKDLLKEPEEKTESTDGVPELLKREDAVVPPVDPPAKTDKVSGEEGKSPATDSKEGAPKS